MGALSFLFAVGTIVGLSLGGLGGAGRLAAVGMGIFATSLGVLAWRRRGGRAGGRLLGAAGIAVGATGLVLSLAGVALTLAALDHLSSL